METKETKKKTSKGSWLVDDMNLGKFNDDELCNIKSALMFIANTFVKNDGLLSPDYVHASRQLFEYVSKEFFERYDARIKGLTSLPY